MSDSDMMSRIENREATVGVVGLGYVGLPLAHSFANAGFSVVGFDVDASKIAKLNDGESYLDHVNENLFEDLASSSLFDSTADMSRLKEVDAILVAVPTPLGTHDEPDLSFVQSTAQTIAANGRDGQLVVLESTTYPGTTRDEFAPLISERLTDVQFAYSPEREDPGRDLATSDVPKLVGGLTEHAGKLAVALYAGAIEQVVEVASAEVAEAAKILENVFRAVNIALVNEIKVALDLLGIDVWEVIEAAATKPFGFMKFTPGPGLGGHCIPIDPFYLTWKAKEVGATTRFIELSGLVNASMPAYVVQKSIGLLNRMGLAASRSKVLVVGLAYKPNVGDIRESPSLELISLLRQEGAQVDYHDPHVPSTWRMRQYNLQLESVELSERSIKEYDVVIVATDHDVVDFSLLAEHAKSIVDTRNALDGMDVKGQLTKA